VNIATVSTELGYATEVFIFIKFRRINIYSLPSEPAGDCYWSFEYAYLGFQMKLISTHPLESNFNIRIRSQAYFFSSFSGIRSPFVVMCERDKKENIYIK
jgi:hypothetical protein